MQRGFVEDSKGIRREIEGDSSDSRVHLIFHFGLQCAAFITFAPLTLLNPTPMPLTMARTQILRLHLHREMEKERRFVAILRFIVKWFHNAQKLQFFMSFF